MGRGASDEILFGPWRRASAPEHSQPQGGDPTAAALAKEVAEAKTRILAEMNANPTQSRRAYELRLSAQGYLSGGALSLALNRLLDEGALLAEGDLIFLPG